MFRALNGKQPNTLKKERIVDFVVPVKRPRLSRGLCRCRVAIEAHGDGEGVVGPEGAADGLPALGASCIGIDRHGRSGLGWVERHFYLF